MLEIVDHQCFMNLSYYINMFNFIYLVLIANQPFGNVYL